VKAQKKNRTDCSSLLAQQFVALSRCRSPAPLLGLAGFLLGPNHPALANEVTSVVQGSTGAVPDVAVLDGLRGAVQELKILFDDEPGAVGRQPQPLVEHGRQWLILD